MSAAVVTQPTPVSIAGRAVSLRFLGVAIAAWLALLPFGSSAYTVGVVGRILAFGLFVASLDFLVGIAGLPSLGHGAFFGIGGYAAALLARDVTAVGPAQLVVAGAVGAAAAGLTGLVTIRSRGTYFLMLTLAIGELARQLADSWTSLTGGTNGLAGVPALQLVPGGGPVEIAGHIYWYVLAVTAVAFGLLAAVRASAFGQALKGVRDNEDRMRALGYSVSGLKLAALVVGGGFAGIAGSLWLTQLRFVSPSDVGFTTSALALLCVAIGGRGSLWGAFAAAAVVIVVRDELGTVIGGRGPLLLGLTFIAVVYLLPGGVSGLVPPALQLHRGAAR